MSHSFADDADRNTFSFGRLNPAMARDIHCQRHIDREYFSNSFKPLIYAVADITVNRSFVCVRRLNYREQVVTLVFGIFCQYRLHFGSPFYNQTLAGFTAAISDVTAFQVGLSQECHIYETHSAQIETHHEHIPGEFELGILRQIQFFYFPDSSQRERTFHGFFYAGIDVAERTSVLGHIVFNGAVINGSQNAHIK